ncbi:helix-turn-helix domain-containing protein [Candidatus Dojkabacteria bacterium]|nr:helix-turn-helix domain-containing protein [Candidatus Dojkabacteria bacterium]
MQKSKMYTPAQVAEVLQLNKNTVYELIGRGEIIAKRIGKVYRIPKSSINYAFTGLDEDIEKAEQEDLKNNELVNELLNRVRHEEIN